MSLDEGAIAPVRVKQGAVHWEVRSEHVRAAIAPLLGNPDEFAKDTAAAIHRTPLVSVVRVTLRELPPGSWLLRHTHYAKSNARRRDFFRTAAPLRAFRNAIAMEQAGHSVPRALAGGVQRVLRVPCTGYLLTEEVPDAVTLATLARTTGRIPGTAIEAVAAAIAALHQTGFVHGDLTINNVLLDRTGRPWFIDLERTRKVRRPVNWRESIEDFHRFARHFGSFSPAGKRAAVRLLDHYCRARGWSGREQEFMRALERRLRHKIAADRPA